MPPSYLETRTAASTLENRASHLRDACELKPKMRQAWKTLLEWIESEKRNDHWQGELSTSALSTATAISALWQTRDRHNNAEIVRAIKIACGWLAEHQNPDGGFGDTDRSHSNIATSFLVLAAWKMTCFSNEVGSQVSSLEQYIEQQGSWQGLRARYGKDKTFVVPILSNCALAGLVPWKQVPALPFEAAWLPQDWYRLARMPVVSYAVPALVAIGQARFHFAPPRNPMLWWLRKRAQSPTLRVLERMQPTSGGYLEATPLTSFVLMNLAAMGQTNTRVARQCLKFILDSRLPDGSWPIDTNLATWVTSLSLSAQARILGDSKRTVIRQEKRFDPIDDSLSSEEDEATTQVHLGALTAKTIRWLLSCQHLAKHPFTGATPGGWGWTNLSGAVPDSDDTPAALLALSKLNLETHPRLHHQVATAASRGLSWLYRLQNRDGGWPTFCKGWGKLPFDRSGTDLTAHALRAFHAWSPRRAELSRVAATADSHLRLPSKSQIAKAIARGFQYLSKNQQPDGSWLPLWFGNQDRPGEDNPIYGTGKVLLAYAELGQVQVPTAQNAIQFLIGHQNSDGGWGGGASVPYGRQCDALRAQSGHGIPTSEAGSPPEKNGLTDCVGGSSLEETAIALEALILCGGDYRTDPTIMRGLGWLTETVIQLADESKESQETGFGGCATPIGFYFAKLWYYERMYPAVFTLGALGAALSKELGTVRVQ